MKCSSCGEGIIFPKDNPALKGISPLCPLCKPKMFSGETVKVNGHDVNLFFLDWKNGAMNNPPTGECPHGKPETWGDYIKYCEPCEHRRKCWNQE